MHTIKIETSSPSTINVDELMQITLKFTNTHPQQSFPGMRGIFRMIWAHIDANNIHVNREFILGQLAPGEFVEIEYPEVPRTDGMLLFYLHFGPPVAIDDNHVDFLDHTSNPLGIGQIFHVVRVKSLEEANQNLANWLAFIALLVLIIMELIGWKLQGLIG